MKSRTFTFDKVGKKIVSKLPSFIVGVVIGFGGSLLIPRSIQTSMPLASPIAQLSPTVSPDNHADYTLDNLVIRLNEARISAGLTQLKTDSYLSVYAQQDLVDNCPVVSHDNFRTLYDKGIFKKYNQVGEVLASGQITPQQSVQAFLDSPTHKDVILSPSFTNVGIGLVAGKVNCVSFIVGN